MLPTTPGNAFEKVSGRGYKPFKLSSDISPWSALKLETLVSSDYIFKIKMSYGIATLI